MSDTNSNRHLGGRQSDEPSHDAGGHVTRPVVADSRSQPPVGDVISTLPVAAGDVCEYVASLSEVVRANNGLIRYFSLMREGDDRAPDAHLAVIMKNISFILPIMALRLLVDTIERYFRYYADRVAQIGQREGMVYHWGVKNGVRSSFSHLGFDLGDTCSSRFLTPPARSALSHARFIATSRGLLLLLPPPLWLPLPTSFPAPTFPVSSAVALSPVAVSSVAVSFVTIPASTTASAPVSVPVSSPAGAPFAQPSKDEHQQQQHFFYEETE
ncbi:uncharacterized protein BYT42DRAFT_617013 [Radiomyces spectabilis]|uniref:uncharacterized protein n=1 Tax=Radiomyces spectabilis TaxID=64574 RepID=UPI00221F4E50|nr:uncharacterized protein BYT42DRAFT_617013 [Radiomyces spectabilis]KAI8370464.1 hypothetical protein BYT42DRAFT_617013 [Radiomyces spectabilis]